MKTKGRARSDADYFTSERRVAKAAHGGCWIPHPTPEKVEHVLRLMPADTAVQRRDRAIMAFLYLTGARDGALITLRMANVDEANRCVNFRRPEVRTKFGKVFTVTFFPVPAFVAEIFLAWMEELRRDRLFGPGDPVFPKQSVSPDREGTFRAGDLTRAPWRSAAKAAAICKAAFETAGLPPSTPHLIRKTLVDLANPHRATPEAFKAWSQNLAHEDVMMTLRSYGAVAPGRQRDVLLAMGEGPEVIDEAPPRG